ncbi:MAG: hypothetical protein ACYSVY_07335, partial [Planctomycetota bacterium]
MKTQIAKVTRACLACVCILGVAAPALGDETPRELRIILLDIDQNLMPGAEVGATGLDSNLIKAEVLPEATYSIDGVGTKTTVELSHPEFGTVLVELLIPTDPVVELTFYWDTMTGVVEVGAGNGLGCGDPTAGSCFESNGSPYCDDLECCEIVCAVDPFCCDVTWDGVCAGEALELCANAPTGACCFADASCQDVNELDCGSAGGVFHGIGTDCANTTCPGATTSDLCADAIPVGVPSLTAGSTSFATVDGEFPFCGTSVSSAGVWYSVIGTGNTMTASTCGPFFNYDTKVTVYCGSCEEPTCVDGNDDNCAGGASGLLSTVTWCSQAGAEYLILVHGFGSASGDFELSLSDDGAPCSGGVQCLPEGACCVGSECVGTTTEADCVDNIGGEWFEGETCAGVFLGYAVEDCQNPFVDISGTGIEAPNASNIDDAGDLVPLGFTFNFWGDDHTNVSVASNGYLTFGGDDSDFTNDPIPTTIDPNDAIFPYWDDWAPNQGGTVHYQSFAGPNRFMAQWTNVPHFPNVGSSTFQAIVFENGSIEFRYGDLNFDSPTIGVENQDGTDGTGVDPGTVAAGDCLRFTPLTQVGFECPTQELPLDIKPGSCPNSYNRNSNGVLPVAVLGTGEHNLTQVDLASIQLSRADGVGGSIGPNEGGGELCDCHDLNGDGEDDLSMKFKTNDLVEALELNDLPAGALVELVVTGSFLDGTPFTAADCV